MISFQSIKTSRDHIYSRGGKPTWKENNLFFLSSNFDPLTLILSPFPFPVNFLVEFLNSVLISKFGILNLLLYRKGIFRKGCSFPFPPQPAWFHRPNSANVEVIRQRNHSRRMSSISYTEWLIYVGEETGKGTEILLLVGTNHGHPFCR